MYLKTKNEKNLQSFSFSNYFLIACSQAKAVNPTFNLIAKTSL